jgi:hypothetical protein
MGPRHTQRAQRYRRYRILGLLPGLVMVGGGLYLGLAQHEWLVLVAGAAFLLLCAAMIASDRPAARRTASVTGPQSPPSGERSVPQPLPLRRDASAPRPRLVRKRA